jgi:hypothetical protein
MLLEHEKKGIIVNLQLGLQFWGYLRCFKGMGLCKKLVACHLAACGGKSLFTQPGQLVPFYNTSVYALA